MVPGRYHSHVPGISAGALDLLTSSWAALLAGGWQLPWLPKPKHTKAYEKARRS